MWEQAVSRRATANDGFKFLVMSYVEALLFISIKRKQVSCELLRWASNLDCSAPTCLIHTGPGNCFHVSSHSPVASCGNSGKLEKGSAQGYIKAWLLVSRSKLEKASCIRSIMTGPMGVGPGHTHSRGCLRSLLRLVVKEPIVFQ